MDPCILEIRRDLGIGSELKVFVDACIERLNEGYMLLGRRSGEERSSSHIIRMCLFG